jgi:hypothetical protein
MTKPMPLNLVGLQSRLDALDVGGQLAIATADFRRLFGVNDLGEAHLLNFAAGHGCAVEPRISSIVFRKMSKKPRR